MKLVRCQRRKTAGGDSGGHCLGLRRNRGEIAEIVVFNPIGDGFQVFCITPVSDPDTGNLPLLGHIYSLLFLNDGIIGELITSDPAAFFYKTSDVFGVGFCLWNLI